MKNIDLKNWKSGLCKFAAIVIPLILCVNSCEKEKPVLPPETQTGANTFGCYINNKLYIRERGTAWFGISLYAKYYQSYNKLIIQANAKKGMFYFEVLNPEVNVKQKFASALYSGEDPSFLYEGENTGEIFLTRYDLDNGIISGTFKFEIPLVYGSGKDMKIKVTQGRFDIRNFRAIIW